MATIRDRYILEVDTVGGVRNLGTATTAAGGLGGALRGIGPIAAAAGGALAAIGVGSFVSSVASATAEMQDLTTTLETVTGSSEGAQNALSFIQDFATTTPFDIQNLTEAFIRLENAGITPTRDLMTTLGDAAAVSTDKVGALEAVTQLFSRSVQGGLGLEDLDRLADRGINVYGILREELNLTRQDISEFGKTAEGAAEIQEALLRGFEREYGGGMDRAADNLSTSLSNLGIAANNALIQVGEGGLAGGLQYAAEQMSALLGENSALAEGLGAVLGEAIRTATDLLTGLIERFQEGGPQVEFLKTSFDAIVEVVTALWEAIGPVSEALEPLANVIFPALGEIISFVADVLVTLIEGFANFVTGISEAITGAESFGDAVTGVFSTIYDTIVGTVTSLVDSVIDLFQGLYDALWGNSIIRDLIDGIIEGFTGLGPDLLEIVRNLVNNVIDAFSEIFSAIVDGIGGAIETGLQRVSDAYQAFKDRFFGDSDDIEQAADATKSALEESLNAEGLTAAAVQAAAEEVASLTDGLNTVTPLIEAHTEDLEQVADNYERASEQIDTLNDLMENYIEAVEDLNRAHDNQVEYTEELVDLYDELNPNLESANEYYTDQLDVITQLVEQVALTTQNLLEEINAYEELNPLIEQNAELTEENLDASEGLLGLIQQLIEAVRSYSQGLAQMAENTRTSIDETNRLTDALSRMAAQALEAQRAAQAATSALNQQAAAAQQAVAPQSTNPGTANQDIFDFFDNFAGGFASGGNIPFGQFGLVGERGPELINGPANITPLDRLGDTTTINYNINAVDAQSFKSLVARDPAFIHSVAQQGARSIPRSR